MPAIVAADELQVTESVRFLLLPSLYLPVAVNCWVVPLATCALDGVTVIEVKLGEAGVGLPEVEALWPPPPQPARITKVTNGSARSTDLRPTNSSKRSSETGKKHVRCQGVCFKYKIQEVLAWTARGMGRRVAKSCTQRRQERETQAAIISSSSARPAWCFPLRCRPGRAGREWHRTW